jgi:hypothetical protein
MIAGGIMAAVAGVVTMAIVAATEIGMTTVVERLRGLQLKPEGISLRPFYFWAVTEAPRLRLWNWRGR